MQTVDTWALHLHTSAALISDYMRYMIQNNLVLPKCTQSHSFSKKSGWRTRSPLLLWRRQINSIGTRRHQQIVSGPTQPLCWTTLKYCINHVLLVAVVPVGKTFLHPNHGILHCEIHCSPDKINSRHMVTYCNNNCNGD